MREAAGLAPGRVLVYITSFMHAYLATRPAAVVASGEPKHPEDPMATLNIPDDTYRRLAARAAAQGITVDALATPALEHLAQGTAADGHPPTAAADPAPPTGDAWRQKFEEL